MSKAINKLIERGLSIITREDIENHIKHNNITIAEKSLWRKKGSRFTPPKKKRK